MKLNYTSVKNPIYTKEGLINCLVQFEGFSNEIPFTANPNDIEEHGKQIYQECKNGKYGEILPYVENILNAEHSYNYIIGNNIKSVLKQYDYDNEQQLATYAGTINKYQKEAQAIQEYIIKIWSDFETLTDNQLISVDPNDWIKNYTFVPPQ